MYEAQWPGAWKPGKFDWIGIGAEIPESSLTSRQRQLLDQELPVGQWTADAIADAAQWKGPLLWNENKGVYERLLDLSGAFRRRWAADEPPAGPHAGLAAAHPLSGGTVLRLSFPIPECTASIELMIDAGFDPDTIDPRNVHVRQRRNTAAYEQFEGPTPRSAYGCCGFSEEDGSWDDSDELIFGRRFDWIGWNPHYHQLGAPSSPLRGQSVVFLAIDQNKTRPHHPAAAVTGAPDTVRALYQRAIS